MQNLNIIISQTVIRKKESRSLVQLFELEKKNKNLTQLKLKNKLKTQNLIEKTKEFRQYIQIHKKIIDKQIKFIETNTFQSNSLEKKN